MKPIITTILLFLLKLISAQPLPDSIGLTEMRQLASKQAIDVLTAKSEAKLAALDMQLLSARLKPRLDLSANLPNYFSSFNETTQPDGTVAFRPVTINNSSISLQATQQLAATGGVLFASTNLQRFDDYENDLKSYKGSPVRIGILQPILGFNRWKWEKRILPLAEKESNARMNVAGEKAAADATALFFDLLFAQQSRNIAQTNQAASSRLLDIAKERYELGKINRGDLVQIEMELAAAGQNLLSAERRVAAASQSIYNFLGIVYAGEKLAAKLPDTPPVLSLDRELLMNKLTNSQPEFINAMRQQMQAERDLQQTKRTYGPKINLQASIGLVRSDLELKPIYADPQSEQIVSLQVNLPILDWGERRKAIESSQTQLELTQDINSRKLLSIKGQADLLLLQYEDLGEELSLAKKISELANERFTISQESYLLGSIPLTELTLAQQNRDQLARAYLSTLGAYWQVWAALKALIVE